tara:strand:+ start:30198 stop:31445 length:1248 start_codon:yes stop_codon:yes gene_type:complete
MEKVNKNSLMNWIDKRLPVTENLERHLTKHPVPKKVNFFYIFGALLMVIFMVQVITGIWLMMFYTNTEEGAFASVEFIMRDVEYGWLMRYMHSTGASAFFFLMYFHMFRGLLYGSYQKPKELVWLFGCFLLFLLMAEGFLGYVLPWGQMSYWAANVILSLFGAIPWIGPDLQIWIQGDYVLSGATLSRFFALHVVVVPLLMIALVVFHIFALHEVGAGNPEGVDIEKYRDKNGMPLDGAPFHPYKTLSALPAIGIFFVVFFAIVFFAPEGGGYFLEKPNFEEADFLKTPEHIAPVWYYAPFYSILRAVTFGIPLLGITSKFLGFIIFAGSIAILFVVPWLDRSNVQSIRYKGIYSKVAMVLFAASFLTLGYLGTKPVNELRTLVAQICTLLYFLPLILMPIYTKYEKTQPVPDRL